MDIIRKMNKQTIFNDIANGDCFEYNGDIYLKVAPYEYMNIGTNKMVSLNAVNLTDGYITSLNNSIPVKFIRMRVEEVSLWKTMRNFVLLNLLLNQTPMVVFVTNIGAHGTTPEQKNVRFLISQNILIGIKLLELTLVDKMLFLLIII